MEQSNKIQRSEVWEQIYKVVSKIPKKEVDGDAADASSVATELEELFLKLLPIHDVSNSFCNLYKKKCIGKLCSVTSFSEKCWHLKQNDC